MSAPEIFKLFVSGFGGEIWILLAEDFPSAQKLSLKNVATLSHGDVMVQLSTGGNFSDIFWWCQFRILARTHTTFASGLLGLAQVLLITFWMVLQLTTSASLPISPN